MWFIKKIPKKQTITFSKLRFILLAQELHCYTNVLQKKTGRLLLASRIDMKEHSSAGHPTQEFFMGKLRILLYL